MTTHAAIAAIVAASLGLGLPCAAQPAPHSPPQTTQPEEQPVDTLADNPLAVLGFTMTDIRGEPQPLEEYAGSVVMMVNVASECGLTPQYAALETLYERFKDRGLVVLGFPANNFGGQEPGSDEEIQEFCTTKFGVKFPMFSKISVAGEDRHPLYTKLAEAMEEQGGEPTWNFTKYLVDRDGHVVKRVDPRTAPDDPAVVAEIERLLDEPVPAGDDSPA